MNLHIKNFNKDTFLELLLTQQSESQKDQGLAGSAVDLHDRHFFAAPFRSGLLQKPETVPGADLRLNCPIAVETIHRAPHRPR